MKPERVRGVRIGAHVTLWVVVMGLLLPGMYRDYRLATRGRRTIGTLVVFEPGNHRQAVFEYTVGQNRYRGSEPVMNDPQQNPEVWYDPEAPQRATLERAQSWRVSMLIASGVGVVFLSLASLLIEVRVRRLLKRQHAAD